MRQTAMLLIFLGITLGQAIALNTKPKRQPAEYMDLRFVNEVMGELGQK
jgi:hypothetical protein